MVAEEEAETEKKTNELLIHLFAGRIELPFLSVRQGEASHTSSAYCRTRQRAWLLRPSAPRTLRTVWRDHMSIAQLSFLSHSLSFPESVGTTSHRYAVWLGHTSIVQHTQQH